METTIAFYLNAVHSNVYPDMVESASQFYRTKKPIRIPRVGEYVKIVESGVSIMDGIVEAVRYEYADMEPEPAIGESVETVEVFVRQQKVFNQIMFDFSKEEQYMAKVFTVPEMPDFKAVEERLAALMAEQCISVFGVDFAEGFDKAQFIAYENGEIHELGKSPIDANLLRNIELMHKIASTYMFDFEDNKDYFEDNKDEQSKG